MDADEEREDADGDLGEEPEGRAVHLGFCSALRRDSAEAVPEGRAEAWETEGGAGLWPPPEGFRDGVGSKPTSPFLLSSLNLTRAALFRGPLPPFPE